MHNFNVSNVARQCEQIAQQLINTTNQSNQVYQQMLQKEQQNVTALQQLIQKEQEAVHTIQQALQNHQNVIQQLNQIQQLCKQLEQTTFTQPVQAPSYTAQTSWSQQPVSFSLSQSYSAAGQQPSAFARPSATSHNPSFSFSTSSQQLTGASGVGASYTAKTHQQAPKFYQ
jgi:uncharacterized membrane protein YccC